MKITRKGFEVKFDDAQEAARFIARYAGAGNGTRLHTLLCQEFPLTDTTYEERQAIYQAALDKLGVTTTIVADPVPTWTSRKGETFRLKDMPTPYLEAALKFARKMYLGGDGLGLNYASGLADAIEAELSKRPDFVNRRGR